MIDFNFYNISVKLVWVPALPYPGIAVSDQLSQKPYKIQQFE